MWLPSERPLNLKFQAVCSQICQPFVVLELHMTMSILLQNTLLEKKTFTFDNQ